MPSIIYRLRRLHELGIQNSALIVRNKIRNQWFCWRFKKRALAKTAQHKWNDIAQKHAVDFPVFWQQYSSKSLPSLQPQTAIISQANAYTQNIFDILGSGPQKFTQIPWHEDIRLQAQNPQADYTFDSTSFYKDIQIKTGLDSNIIKDIKVPWELSRCQHLPILGQAYAATNDPKYAQTFTMNVQDWLEKNPYLIGINWLCPMEVAIRAINLIWAWSYLQSAPDISIKFWEQFTCSLYNHMHYLEHNWEIFDTKTSNHYLSDLLGYLYLCWFFQDLDGVQKKRDWCVNELLKEFDRQVFNEGTDYESTTAYHCLVTEIFNHMAMLAKLMNIELPDTFHAKLARMHEFIEWCKVNETDMVKIGDDDSGRIVKFDIPRYTVLKTDSTRDERVKKTTHLSDNICTIPNLSKTSRRELLTPPFIPSVLRSKMYRGTEDRRDKTTFPAFGLSIIKTNPWHITLRHLAYQKKQPTAHFHNDALSITLAVNGVPIFIDPGSYLYTASSMWRNYFRSVTVHNTFNVEDHEPVPFDDRLFALDIPEKVVSAHLPARPDPSIHRSASDTRDERIQKDQPVLSSEAYRRMFCESKNVTKDDFCSSHELYSQFDLTLSRNLTWNDQEVVVTDSWNKPNQDMKLAWNFTLHPNIEVKIDNNQWVFTHQGKPLLTMQSPLEFKLYPAWASLEYGIKTQSIGLKANYCARLGNECKIVFIRL